MAGQKHKSRRAYQLGLRQRSPQRKASQSSIFRMLLVDYGGFTGAVIGAVGTIIAGAIAWYGVQDQLKYQKSANDLSELTALQAEADRLYTKIIFYKKVEDIIRIMYNAKLSLLVSGPKSLTEAIKELQSTTSEIKPLSDLVEAELRKGAAGSTGLDVLDHIDTCNRALILARSMNLSSDDTIIIDLNDLDKDGSKEIDITRNFSTAKNRSRMVVKSVESCLSVKDDAIFKLITLRMSLIDQIKRIETRTSVIRAEFSQ